MNKPHVLFLPGMLCDQRVWQYQIDHLKDICQPDFLDLRNYSQFGQMLSAIAKASTFESIIVGFSMGGYLALEYALQGEVLFSKLAIIGTTAKGYPESEKNMRRKLLSQIQQGQYTGMNQERLRLMVHPDQYSNEELLNLIKQMEQDAGEQVFVNQLTATLNRENREPLLSGIQQPTLLVGAKHDQIAPHKAISTMASLIPHSELHILEDCGHMIPLEQPQILTKILQQWVTA
ncbi:alpha/beta hydrolase [Endozoicomonas sp. SM1973]|uniref:Alpha/beta hydrolase n=1 Tax=Spartinivicinus marinus TaxID=2994442 RepID=A0A853IBI1_9GAMM|nr:alpha/beta hydrolase [Spartinivicinus marinus]MCX4026515.1 alpha/beta hydrolase [Spartinivicinus marinus]NYZ66887.1 alpha/beta hydrolase [Spartinivicinus marinus]